jgi:hypothetical protein
MNTGTFLDIYPEIKDDNFSKNVKRWFILNILEEIDKQSSIMSELFWNLQEYTYERLNLQKIYFYHKYMKLAIKNLKKEYFFVKI